MFKFLSSQYCNKMILELQNLRNAMPISSITLGLGIGLSLLVIVSGVISATNISDVYSIPNHISSLLYVLTQYYFV
jgi:hypothetical protein